jgi:hypothetical protein
MLEFCRGHCVDEWGVRGQLHRIGLQLNNARMRWRASGECEDKGVWTERTVQSPMLHSRRERRMHVCGIVIALILRCEWPGCNSRWVLKTGALPAEASSLRQRANGRPVRVAESRRCRVYLRQVSKEGGIERENDRMSILTCERQRRCRLVGRRRSTVGWYSRQYVDAGRERCSDPIGRCSKRSSSDEHGGGDGRTVVVLTVEKRVCVCEIEVVEQVKEKTERMEMKATTMFSAPVVNQ